MKRDKFRIAMYSAEQLINYSVIITKTETGDSGFCFEFEQYNQNELRQYLKSTDEYYDNALFYQIRKVVEESATKDNTDSCIWNEDSLQKYLIFVDFSDVFKWLKEGSDENELKRTYKEEELKSVIERSNDEYKVYSLFKNGIRIIYKEDNDKKIIEYVPFDKSNSMSRQGKISFINKEILEKLNTRLNLGISFSKQSVNLSKYYAYKGLYLSDAIRAELDKNTLNAEKVIIINDSYALMGNQKIVTAKQSEEKNRNKWKVEEASNQTFKINEVFDGEGLISFEYAKIINQLTGLEGATSYQIRMPFVKGMLHTVDFKGIIKHYLGDSTERIIIKDIFGAERDLMKAEIIMPASMFKCKKWLKNDVEKKSSEKTDCMVEYFKRFHEYNHAIYISNTDLYYGKSNITRLNYQFLNTLALNDDEFKELVKDHSYFVSNPIEYLKRTAWQQNNSKTETENIVDDSLNQEDGYQNWMYALQRNEVFAREYKIKGILSGISNGLKYDCARGNLLVNGEIRYLSRDLLKFVLDLIKDDLDKDFCKYVKADCLHEDRFFMPRSKIKLDYKKYYPILRNPHLSRNEQCALRPYLCKKEGLYNRFFGHLSGVIMVAYNSLVPQALGGADFDGDIVKILDDDRIQNAVLRGAYEKVESEDVKYIRKLPIIVIPKAKNRTDSQVTGMTDYFVIKDTFSNHIGQISNLSIRLGKEEYDKGSNAEHSCAECTILTGLEIDAAKTGMHPELNDILNYTQKQESGFDFIRDFKTKIDRMSRARCRLYGNMVERIENTDSYIFKGYSQKIDYHYNGTSSVIDKIPYYFFEIIKQEPILPGAEMKMDNGRYCYFDFLVNDEWKNKINEDIQKKIAAIMQAYYKVERLNKYRMEIEKVGDTYESFIKTLLNLQYDRDEYNEKVYIVLPKVFAWLESLFNSKESVAVALSKVNETNWAFLLESQKQDALKNILGEKTEGDDIIGLLTNYGEQGYNILFYILKNIENIKSEESSDDRREPIETEEDKPQNKVDIQYFKEFYGELYKGYLTRSGEKISNLKDVIMTYCMKKIKELLGEDSDLNLYLMYSLKGKTWADCKSEFFWRYISKDDIDKHVIKEVGGNVK